MLCFVRTVDKRWGNPMYCKYCGATIKKETKYCPKCGKKIENDSIRQIERKQIFSLFCKKYIRCSKKDKQKIKLASLTIIFFMGIGVLLTFVSKKRRELEEGNANDTAIEDSVSLEEENANDEGEKKLNVPEMVDAKTVYDQIAADGATMPHGYSDNIYILPEVVEMKFYGDGSYGEASTMRYRIVLVIKPNRLNWTDAGYYMVSATDASDGTHHENTSYESVINRAKDTIDLGEKGYKGSDSGSELWARSLMDTVEIYLDEEWTFSGKIDEIDWNNWGPGKIPVYIKQSKSFIDISEYCTSE